MGGISWEGRTGLKEWERKGEAADGGVNKQFLGRAEIENLCEKNRPGGGEEIGGQSLQC